MTVTYTLEVSTARLLGFPRLLIKWKGSIYKLMYRETILFLLAYYLIMLLYRVVLNESGIRYFEMFAIYCRAFLDLIPITFVMGFYVSVVVTRWWNQYLSIPFPDRVNLQIATFVKGTDERSRLIRRSLSRYVNLMSILVFRNVAKPVMKRFPTMDHLIEAGILTIDERLCLEETPCAHGNWWIPSNWFMSLVSVARQEGRITDDYHMKMIIDEVLALRSSAGMMFSYDWISVPLVYTQVVTLAVYCFVVACLFGRQYLFEIPEYGTPLANYVDYYFPLFTTFQFFFYMGWLKVAEELICAYGDDDDDFDINWCIDRNVQTSYMMVDDLYNKHPALTRDAFWDESHAEVPYTEAAVDYKQTPFIGSAADIDVPSQQQEWAHRPAASDAPKKASTVGNQSISSLRRRFMRQRLVGPHRASALTLDIEKRHSKSNMTTEDRSRASSKRKAPEVTEPKSKASPSSAKNSNSQLDVGSRKESQISSMNNPPSSLSSFRSRSTCEGDSVNRTATSLPHPNAVEEYNSRKNETGPSTQQPQEDSVSIISAMVSSAADSPNPGSQSHRPRSKSSGRESEQNPAEAIHSRPSMNRSISQPSAMSAAYDNHALSIETLGLDTDSQKSFAQSQSERKLTPVSEEDMQQSFD